MRFAVIGDLGMFGSDLKAYLKSAGYPVSGFNRSNLDLELNEESLASKLATFDVIVNAVAFTAVDQAEREPDRANRINGEYAGKLARASEMSSAKFIHISTDYVFDGSARSPISPLESLSPINAYGRSKALGERLVAASQGDFVILRTAWLYGGRGKCFPRSIAKKLLEEGQVEVVNDQIGQPTWTKDLAAIALAHSVNDFGERVVHAVSSGEVSWYEFAVAINDSLMDGGTRKIRQVATSVYPAPAKRPNYSVLANLDTKGPIIENWLDRWKIAAPEVLDSV